MKATFENSVNVLVKAYFNNTLQHHNCHACAVGNLVTNAMGYEYIPTKGLQEIKWSHTEYYRPNFNHSWKPSWFGVVKKGRTGSEFDHANEQIRATGYTVDQLKKIESSFECADKDGDYMFNGLMAVVDVLADIHGIDLKSKEEAKALFVKV